MFTTVQLKAKNGRYVCAENGGGGAVIADRQAAGDWETFTLVYQGGAQLNQGSAISLKTDDDHYLSAKGGGGGIIVADRSVIGAWEIFRINNVGDGAIESGSKVSLQASNGQYVCAEAGGGRELVANRNVVGAWETFTVETNKVEHQLGADVERDFGGGKHGTCHAVLDAGGSLSLLTTTWTNSPFQGFTIGVKALLVAPGEVRGSTVQSYGVDGTMTPFGSPSNRMDAYNEQVDPAFAKKVTEIKLALFHAPKWRIVEVINQASKVAHDVKEAVDNFCANNPDLCAMLKASIGATVRA